MEKSKEEIKQEYLQELSKGHDYSIAKFDEQTLLISGGALGLSLTFIKEIVPLKQCIYLWLFDIAIGLFVFSIILGFAAHLRSAYEIRRRIKSVENDIYNVKTDKTIPTINIILAISLILGIISLVLYCSINLNNYKNIESNKASKQVIEIIKSDEKGGFIKIDGEVKSIILKDSLAGKGIINLKPINHE